MFSHIYVVQYCWYVFWWNIVGMLNVNMSFTFDNEHRKNVMDNFVLVSCDELMVLTSFSHDPTIHFTLMYQ